MPFGGFGAPTINHKSFFGSTETSEWHLSGTEQIIFWEHRNLRMAPVRHRTCTEQIKSEVFFVDYQEIINFSGQAILLQAPKVTCLVPNSPQNAYCSTEHTPNTLPNITSVQPNHMTESRQIGRSIFGILGALGEPWFPSKSHIFSTGKC